MTSHGWPVAWIVEIISCELDDNSPNLTPLELFPSVNCWASAGALLLRVDNTHAQPSASTANQWHGLWNIHTPVSSYSEQLVR